jgi:predicted acylesterase/phospholipase RssA
MATDASLNEIIELAFSELEEKEKGHEPISIKHLVISGGGVAGFSFYGALRESNKKNIWNIENIESIHGTSVGSLMGVLIALKYDWSTLDDYLIKRPWQNLYKFNLFSIMEGLKKRGIFDIKVMEETFTPLISGKDISIDITMKEFYELTKIDLHIYLTEIHNFECIDVCHKKYPDWKLLDAVYSSCSLPVLFAPILSDGKCYCDGGLLMNYPVSYCVKNGANPKEILGVSRMNDNSKDFIINEESSLLDYGLILIYRAMEKLLTPPEKINIGIEYNIISPRLSLYDIINTAASEEERIKLIEAGVKYV